MPAAAQSVIVKKENVEEKTAGRAAGSADADVIMLLSSSDEENADGTQSDDAVVVENAGAALVMDITCSPKAIEPADVAAAVAAAAAEAASAATGSDGLGRSQSTLAQQISTATSAAIAETVHGALLALRSCPLCFTRTLPVDTPAAPIQLMLILLLSHLLRCSYRRAAGRCKQGRPVGARHDGTARTV